MNISMKQHNFFRTASREEKTFPVSNSEAKVVQSTEAIVLVIKKIKHDGGEKVSVQCRMNPLNVFV